MRRNVLLPSRIAPRTPAPVEASPKTAGLAELTRVLVVEEDEGVGEFCFEALERIGACRVRVKRFDANILQAATEFLPAVILISTNDASLEGADLVAQLAADSRLSAIPIVQMTFLLTPSQARTNSTSERRYLAKPFTATELAACVKSAIASAPGNPN